MPATPLSLSAAFQSSADSGDDIVSPSFSVDFGNKMSTSDDNTPISGLVKDFATAVAVAVAAKWIWSLIK